MELSKQINVIIMAKTQAGDKGSPKDHTGGKPRHDAPVQEAGNEVKSAASKEGNKSAESAAAAGEENKRTDVLYLSTYAHSGGQSIAANRIHSGLRSIGINSKMLVMDAGCGRDNGTNGIRTVKLGEGEAWHPKHDEVLLEKYPSASKVYKFTAAARGIDIAGRIERFDPKIVQMHWINDNYIKIEDLAKIKRKIVWRLADCWPFTGGCFYCWKCEGYTAQCGKCPKLGSDDGNDLSHEVWLRKRDAYKDLDMTIVVPTHWMKRLAERSSLFKDRRIVVIPNGLDLGVFYPEDKAAAREKLGIAADKKVILYGAGQAMHPRKGFRFLRQALRRLAKEHKDEYQLVIFGTSSLPAGIGIPVKALGFINDKRTLRLAYSAADVMIVPSLEESFGQTVTEAMACAVPVVSFLETGPASTIIHKRTGYLAEYADDADLARGIEWVLSDEARRRTLAENARHRIETTYDIKIVAGQYRQLYDEILRG